MENRRDPPTFATAEEAQLATKRMSAAQLAVSVRCAYRLAEVHSPSLFKRGEPLWVTCEECDDYCGVTADLLLAKRRETPDTDELRKRALGCAIRCEGCAVEVARAGAGRLGDLARTYREAAAVCRELAEMLWGRRWPT